MTTIGEQLSVTRGLTPVGESAAGAEATRTWQDIVTNLADTSLLKGSGAPLKTESLTQLTGLLKTQMEVCRYQLKVEMVSKIAESAVASMRKLQQPQ